jgi:hypothetical protein
MTQEVETQMLPGSEFIVPKIAEDDKENEEEVYEEAGK